MISCNELDFTNLKYCETSIFLPHLINGVQGQLAFGDIGLKVTLPEKSFDILYQDIRFVSLKKYLFSTHLQICFNGCGVIYFLLPNVTFYRDKLLELAPQAKSQIVRPTFWAQLIYYFSNLILWVVAGFPIWFIQANNSRYTILVSVFSLFLFILFNGIYRLSFLLKSDRISTGVMRKLVILSLLLPGIGTYLLGLYLMRYDISILKPIIGHENTSKHGTIRVDQNLQNLINTQRYILLFTLILDVACVAAIWNIEQPLLPLNQSTLNYIAVISYITAFLIFSIAVILYLKKYALGFGAATRALFFYSLFSACTILGGILPGMLRGNVYYALPGFGMTLVGLLITLPFKHNKSWYQAHTESPEK